MHMYFDEQVGEESLVCATRQGQVVPPLVPPLDCFAPLGKLMEAAAAAAAAFSEAAANEGSPASGGSSDGSAAAAGDVIAAPDATGQGGLRGSADEQSKTFDALQLRRMPLTKDAVLATLAAQLTADGVLHGGG